MKVHSPISGCHLLLSRLSFFNRRETRADLKYDGKEPFVNDKITIDVISVTKISL